MGVVVSNASFVYNCGHSAGLNCPTVFHVRFSKTLKISKYDEVAEIGRNGRNV